MLSALIMVLLFGTSLFLILLVLIQRGRGGGLAGAFGGLGGQSAFGTKAGDLFTRITIGVAAFWIILCAASVKMLSTGSPVQQMGPRATATPGAAGGSSPAESVPGAAGGGKEAPAAAPTTGAGAAQPAGEAPAAESAAPAGDAKSEPAK